MTSATVWRKATKSAGTGNCVEVATLPVEMVAIRDSKHPEQGHLEFSAGAWRNFLEGARREALAGTP